MSPFHVSVQHAHILLPPRRKSPVSFRHSTSEFAHAWAARAWVESIRNKDVAVSRQPFIIEQDDEESFFFRRCPELARNCCAFHKRGHRPRSKKRLNGDGFQDLELTDSPDPLGVLLGHAPTSTRRRNSSPAMKERQ